MLSVKPARFVFALAEILAVFSVAFGVMIAIFGAVIGSTNVTVFGAALLCVGFSSLLAAYIGQAAIQIAETNTAILAKLSEK